MSTTRQALGWPTAFRLGLVSLCAVVTVSLPLSFPHDDGPTDLDRDLAAPIHSALDSHPGVYQTLVIPSNGYIVIPLLLVAACWFAYRGQWWRAATMVVVPELAVAVNSWLLKPLWERPLHDYLAYPSGHTVHLVAVASAFVLLTDVPRARATTLGSSVLAMLCAAVGMIGLGYHLPTDILGGAAAAIAMVTALCWPAERFLLRTERVHPAARLDA
ncbi:phosphatase PAP2 family protein [Nocardia sp. NBC_01009]|uniref:phosphatase PAP2 family protein n=1 Tax=Nocardia sp. NBC_01009 TaxID=2975996 RepID=UPI003870D8E9|nr:phosphatase PAP2 family protein [Nocardia sp. NBC_01009]